MAAPAAPSRSKGRAGASTAQDEAARAEFEKQHPRAAKGRAGGGAWIQKGQGMQGEPDTRVRQLQNRLASLGFNVKSDGRFGPATEQAVRSFQTRHGLKADGVVGDATKASLRGAQPLSTQDAAAANAPAAGQASGGGAYGSKYAGDSPEARKARGDQNEQLAGQRDIGTKTKAEKKAAADRKRARRSSGGSGGSADTATDTGEVVDGGSTTDSGSSSGSRSRRGGDVLALGIGMDKQRGDKRVRDLQQMLDDIGMNLGAGGVDGKFGPDTRRALMRFQRKYGLKSDAIFGPKSRTALNTVQKLMNARDRQSPGSSLSEHERKGDAKVSEQLEEAIAARQEAERTGGDIVGTRAVERMLRDELAEADGPKMKLKNKPGKTNWVEKAGGLPNFIRRIAEHVKGKNPGWADGRAIAVAVNAAKKMCGSGDTNLPGVQQVNAGSRAEACAAVASWQAKKGKSMSEAELLEIAVWEQRPVLAEGFTLRELAEAGADPNGGAG